MTQLKIMSIAFIFANVVSAPAAISQSYADYALDEDTHIVSGNNGLEWLQFDSAQPFWTEISSAGEAVDYFSDGGWRLANNQEMSGLLNDFDLGGIFDANPDTAQSYITPGASNGSSGVSYFINLFHPTYAEYAEEFPGLDQDYREMSVAFGDNPTEGDFNRLTVFENRIDHASTFGASSKASGGVFSLAEMSARTLSGYLDGDSGIALVRDSSQSSAHHMPEIDGKGAILALSLLGLMVLIRSEYRGKQQRVLAA